MFFHFVQVRAALSKGLVVVTLCWAEGETLDILGTPAYVLSINRQALYKVGKWFSGPNG